MRSGRPVNPAAQLPANTPQPDESSQMNLPTIEQGLVTLHNAFPDLELDYHRQLGSTNDRGLELARSGLLKPALVLTDHQSAGRGQRASTWWSSESSLTFSYCFSGNVSSEPGAVTCPADPIANATRLPGPSVSANSPNLLPLATAVCLVESIEQLAPQLAEVVQIKWPNDVLIQGRKAAGILCESVLESTSKPASHGRSGTTAFVIGIGINVNQTAAELEMMNDNRMRSPTAIPATSLFHELRHRSNQTGPTEEVSRQQQPLDRIQLLHGIVTRLSRRLSQPADSANDAWDVIEQANRRISYSGDKIRVTLPNKDILVGKLIGFARDGGLQLRVDNQVKTIHSGSIRPSL